MRLKNESSSGCHTQGSKTAQLNGTSGFISKLLDNSALFNEFQGLTVVVRLSQEPGDKG